MNYPRTHADSSDRSLLAWARLMLLFYVLSVGPVVKLTLDHHLVSKAIETINAPLVWLCHTQVGEKTVAPVLMWYGETIWRWQMPPK